MCDFYYPTNIVGKCLYQQIYFYFKYVMTVNEQMQKILVLIFYAIVPGRYKKILLNLFI